MLKTFEILLSCFYIRLEYPTLDSNPIIIVLCWTMNRPSLIVIFTRRNSWSNVDFTHHRVRHPWIKQSQQCPSVESCCFFLVQVNTSYQLHGYKSNFMGGRELEVKYLFCSSRSSSISCSKNGFIIKLIL